MNLTEWARWRVSGSRELRALVMDGWDPIGVAGEPAAADEYDSYLVRIAGGLRLGYGPDRIAADLSTFRVEMMGGPADPERDLAAATAIASWYSEATAERLPSGDIRKR